MRYLTLGEILRLQAMVLEQSGGATGLRDLAALESAVAQPRMSFDGSDLYPDPVAKATALAFSLIRNHPFLDGNKRVGHAALETFLRLNGLDLEASVDGAEAIVLGVAAGLIGRSELQAWIREHTSSQLPDLHPPPPI
ncbi:MAG: type II toxin-antitoxin system death-on-curing family toxin [Anaerolineae bacterium]|nr:type II toxin-antitoxin system death-on-curing family toxin [Ardenticatenia bacterium]MBK8539679.1 type II toxin-antitoxin system death-on-curing family toxin [Ardenticatenia bacterium]HQZ71468.1 type II toxin-antitoxin system death-on-curing family toxin [Anaerolineae bacterium]HRA20943.1 type II toxin-antitoxin system death-on-curing family toxin [Anaerolineae bacterium]